LTIQDRVSMQTIYSLNEAINLATKAEAQLDKSRANIVTWNSFDPTRAAADKGKSPMNQPPPSTTIKGPSSGGAPAKTTGIVPPEAPRNPYARPNSDMCYRCGQPGLRSNQCLRRSTVNLIGPGEETDLAAEEEEDETAYTYDENEIIRGDDGELLSCSLVVHRLLLAQKKKTDQSQRHNIFRTRCTVIRKVCDVIIDSDSSENIVSKNMVTNLGLKTEKHPSSYKISWIKQGAKVSRPESRIHDRHIGKVPLQGSIPMRTQTYIQTYPSTKSIRVQHSSNNKTNFII